MEHPRGIEARRIPRIRGVGLIAILAMLALPAAAGADLGGSDAGDWATDGTVYAIAHGGGKTYIGGVFSHVGPRSGEGLPLSTTTAQPAGAFPEVSGGDVHAAEPDGRGGWYIGGNFDYVGGQARSGLARISPDGNVDLAFNPSPNGTVDALALAPSDSADAGTLYVGGSFSQIGGRNVAFLAALDAGDGSTGNAFIWDAKPDAAVHALEAREVTPTINGSPVKQTLLFVGGDFTKTGVQSAQNGGPRLGVVYGRNSVDGTGAAIAGGTAYTWAPISSGGAPVHALAVAAPKAAGRCGDLTKPTLAFAVYAGGGSAGSGAITAAKFDYTTASTTAADVTTADTCGGAVGGWTPPAINDDVRALALTGGAKAALIVGGSFTTFGGASRNGAAAIQQVDPTASTQPTATPYAWDPKPDEPVASLASSPDGGTVYAGGGFTGLNGIPHNEIAQLSAPTDTTTNNATAGSWDPGLAGGPVETLAMAPDGSAVYAGGGFSARAAQLRSNLAALDSDGSLDATWLPSADARVQTMALSGTTLYFGGAFTHIDGADESHLQPHIGAVDTNTGALTGFRPAGADGWILSLAVSGSTVYAGGSFTQIGGQPRSYIAALDATTGSATPWNPGADYYVNALDAACGAVYAGGGFTSVNGADRSRIAAIDPPTGAPLGWDPDSNSTVYALRRAGDYVFAAGQFSLIGSASRSGVAELNAGDATATSWSPSIAPALARAIALSGDGTALYVGGTFWSAADAGRNNLAGLDTTTGAATAWDPEPSGTVYALAASGPNVFAGGAFNSVGPAMQEGFATFTAGADGPDDPQVTCQGPPALVTPPAAPIGASAPQQQVLSNTTASSPPVKPAITAFSVTPKRFRVGRAPTAMSARVRRVRRTGTKIRYTTSKEGTVTIAIKRVLTTRCKKAPVVKRSVTARHTRGCTKLKSVGALIRLAHAGKNTTTFTGRLGKRALVPGRYRATATLRDAAGKRSRARSVNFTVMR